MDFDNIFEYTKALSENNNRTWFHDNHRRYEQATADFLQLLERMKFMLAQESPELGDSILFLNPKSFMYRIPRDMRYSMGKEPYNPAFRAYLSPAKKNFLPLSYFVCVAHDGCSITGGAYIWEPETLKRIREYIFYNGNEFERIISENGLEIYGNPLKRVPAGYPADHPMSEWMKCRYYITSYRFSEEDIQSYESFVEAARRAVRRFEPLRVFLTEAMVGSIPDFDEY